MHITASILNRLLVLYAAFTEQGQQYTLMEIIRQKGKIKIERRVENFNPEQWKGKKQKYPVVLILGGRGILCKEYPEESEAAKRIINHPEEFLFASEAIADNQVRITFLRREQYDSLMKELTVYKLPVINLRIDPYGQLEKEALSAGTDFFNATLSYKKLLKRSAENDTVFSLITKRLLLPVLGAVLVVLSVNFFVQQNLRKQSQEQQFVLNNLQKSANVQEKKKGQQVQLENMLLPESRYPYAWIADRIALVMPEGITLTELSIHPLSKKIQENKPLESDPDRVTVRGESVSATAVTRLTDTLRLWNVPVSVQLLSLSRDRNNRYVFEIDIRL